MYWFVLKYENISLSMFPVDKQINPQIVQLSDCFLSLSGAVLAMPKNLNIDVASWDRPFVTATPPEPYVSPANRTCVVFDTIISPQYPYPGQWFHRSIRCGSDQRHCHHLITAYKGRSGWRSLCSCSQVVIAATTRACYKQEVPRHRIIRNSYKQRESSMSPHGFRWPSYQQKRDPDQLLKIKAHCILFRSIESRDWSSQLTDRLYHVDANLVSTSSLTKHGSPAKAMISPALIMWIAHGLWFAVDDSMEGFAQEQ